MSPPTSSTPSLARDQWARLRFAVIGPLLACPPESGELQAALKALAERDWQHPISGLPRRFAVSTIERWYYQARRQQDPVSALKPKLRADAGRSRVLSSALKTAITEQHRAHPAWSLQLHYDNLAVRVAEAPELGPLPSYATVRRYCKTCGLVRQPGSRRRDTDGARRAAERLERREVVNTNLRCPVFSDLPAVRNVVHHPEWRFQPGTDQATSKPGATTIPGTNPPEACCLGQWCLA